MGQCCGKEKFQGEGRTLGSSSQNQPNRPIPAAAGQTAFKGALQGKGKTLGSGPSGSNPRDAAGQAAQVSRRLLLPMLWSC
jgi:hypothetical protein